MDLLNLIINPSKIKTVCFLCFTQNEKTTSVSEEIEIRNEYSILSLTLLEMMTNLFPGHDIILDQACDNCTNLIISMYIILRKNKIKKLLLNTITEALSRDICKENSCHLNNQMENMRIKINLPKYKDIILDKKVVSLIDKSDQISEEKENFNCQGTEKNKTKKLPQKIKKVSSRNANKSIVCDICGKILKRPNALRSHLNCHKEKQCPYCLKTLKSHSHFALHVKKHENSKQRHRNKTYYNCHDCSYRSMNKKSLEAHINKIHLCVRPYACHICFKSFYKKSNLTQHELIHEGIKNELCEICGEYFSSKKTLLIHTKLHSDEKSFECTVCGKNYVTSGQRLEHFKRNHCDKLEVCYICGKKYGLKKDLTRHVKKVHFQNQDATYLPSEQCYEFVNA